MDKETIKEELLKHARNAFETASTLRENERIEVYLHDGIAKTSDVLDDSDEILYGDNRVLCYQVQGYDYLEGEIKTWIDYARIIPQPTDDDTPLPEPTDIEKSIRELITDLAKSKGVSPDDISSFEVFANLPMDLLGTIEQQIIEYWWSAEEEENGKKLALAQIEEALA
ncbi:hypothetical protein LOH54_08295 [Sulfurimonas sp. HSL-3221]|uniref:hypothetical protein n=1 Tax=Sulfurimonadaceae TaxID=2771471 RepID=UPI001E2F58F1|nr:hypothetical protein [Sulfurimonas sp. HSL-3221]UFS61662.1 hypothetical protein LOH54_08295 [Sulfurimonas sp. HSL-3221]